MAVEKERLITDVITCVFLNRTFFFQQVKCTLSGLGRINPRYVHGSYIVMVNKAKKNAKALKIHSVILFDLFAIAHFVQQLS